MTRFRRGSENLKEQASVFLALYKKYYGKEHDAIKTMQNILNTLPTNVIYRVFFGGGPIEFYEAETFESTDLSLSDYIEKTEFGLNGLCGWGKVLDVASKLYFYAGLERDGRLDRMLKARGFKVDRRRVGVDGRPKVEQKTLFGGDKK